MRRVLNLQSLPTHANAVIIKGDSSISAGLCSSLSGGLCSAISAGLCGPVL